MKNWKDIHEGFGKMNYQSYKTYQQHWEEENFTYQEAKEWIELGFAPKDYEKAKPWKDYGFNPQQTKSWIEAGLEPKESNFASYLKQNNYQPSTINLEEARNEYYNAQNWLNINYPNKQETNQTKRERETIHY